MLEFDPNGVVTALNRRFTEAAVLMGVPRDNATFFSTFVFLHVAMR